MPRHGFATVALIVGLSTFGSSLTSAQNVSPGPVSAGVESFAPSIVSLQQAGADHKDPFVAGILSFLIPGVGSMYAGNTTHGIVHLGIHVGSYAAFMGSALNGDGGSAADGYLVLLGNDIWSIFTAVNDANAHNGASPTSGRIVGSLYFNPAVVQPSERMTAGTRSMSSGIQVLQLHF